MDIVIFSGPTLSADQGKVYLEASYLPPASQGDIYIAAKKRPRLIGIIDGYFERVPAVLHKEILWAMSQGVHVFGSASIGALRAAELADFGMQGIGAIFESYYEGALEHDDEVALVHGPPEAGYPSGSEPLVNIRFTLAAAQKADIIDAELHYQLIKLSQDIHFHKRTYTTLLLAAEQRGLSIQSLRDWLPKGRINQKHLDAIQMLIKMREFIESNPGPMQVDYKFEHTDMWETVRRSFEQRLSVYEPSLIQEDIKNSTESFSYDAVLEELQLQSADYEFERQIALNRTLALEIQKTHQLQISRTLLKQRADAFRTRNAITEPGQVDLWIQQHGLDFSEYTELIQEEAFIYQVNQIFQSDIAISLTKHLRSTGRYKDLYQRALKKQQLLTESGLENPPITRTGLSENQLWSWFFQQHLNTTIPHDLEAYACARDFRNLAELRRAVIREYCYLHLLNKA